MRQRDAGVPRTSRPRWRRLLANQLERLAAPLAPGLIPYYLRSRSAPRYFRQWEAQGFHVTRNHFYSPIPDTGQLKDELWQRQADLVGIEMNEPAQERLLCGVFPQFAEEYAGIPSGPTSDPHEFHFNNGRFDGTDALVLYCMVRHYRPKTILEVGSGYSTRLALQAAARNGDTAVVCIEPYPDEALRTMPGVSRLIERPAQEVELALFEALRPGDLLFIDSTHVVRTGGDVPFLYLEVLPRLRPGVIVHFHDIFLPQEYPRSWLTEHLLFWNEQYLLHGFLLFNDAFEVLFANNYMGLRHQREMRQAFPHSPWWGGGSFWIRRRVAG